MARPGHARSESAVYRGHAGHRSTRHRDSLPGLAGHRQRGKERCPQDRRQTGRHGPQGLGEVSAQAEVARCASMHRLLTRAAPFGAYSNSEAEKKNGISMAAVSAASEPCAQLRSMEVANILRMVPSAALAGLVAPMVSRH